MNPNLAPQFRKYLEMSDEERIYFIQKDKWIDYPLANKVLLKMQDIFNAPKSIRSRGMLLYGDSNNGKTAILKKFYRDFSKDEYIDEDGDLIHLMPIVYVLSESSSDESVMFNKILSAMNVPTNHKEKIAKIKEEVIYHLGIMKTKLIIIDEIQNVLQGPYNKMTQLITSLKTLNNTTGIPIILAGTQDAMSAISIDNQTKSRFKPLELVNWNNDENFSRFITTIEAMLPLKKASNLYQNYEVLTYLHELSNGCIGEVIDILKDASIYAIRTKSERITKKEIKEIL
ncbi:TniB family NTP-binding protein [Aliarcobacter butzleri]|uniref:TniB family NTP-binding protein n=1 Tax=Aliarcobacter butzleri TaxID=28197 RepID=UPI0021B3EC7F|nr:TniB family NTP-binding protein [Aliarcobacter butzleri]MCT7615073.1 TniB family NTP-binding protein [Aliarcobacter butzleri]UWY60113.1 TniB family NTP-binding protein [Aliarcobacter butzleri]